MEKKRETIIINTSLRDMLANLVIGILELLLGAITNSVAVTSDGVNSLTSSSICLINIRGIKLSRKPPDKEHPYGYGRHEYLTVVIIATMLIITSIFLGYRSFAAIIERQVVSYPYYALFLIGLSALVKIYLGKHARKTGKKLKAGSLRLIGNHTLLESMLEVATLITIALNILVDVTLDAYLGILVASIIFFTGINIAGDYLKTLVGHNVDEQTAEEIKCDICDDDCVLGAYDLSIHDYGHNKKVGTCNIEIEESYSLNEAYKVVNRIKRKIKDKYNIALNVEIYSVNVYDKAVVETREKLRDIAMTYNNVLGMHGFFMNKETKYIKLDLVIDFKEEYPAKLAKEISDEMKKSVIGYEVAIKVDRGC